jgi:hypothetical protein
MFTNKVMSVGNWLLYFLLMAIPIVNIIIIILILMDPQSNKSLKNLIITQLLLVIIVGLLIAGLGISVFNMFN